MDSTNQQNNPNDIEENSSRSTEVGTTDETIISANQVHSEEDQPKKLKNTSIKTANKKRVLQIRAFALLQLLVW
jgi:copper oxidase (laccase) domain-containing protein